MKIKLSIIVVLISASLSGPLLMAQVQNAGVIGGRVEGVLADGVVSFKGIPFAAPPVGDLRWKAPHPVKPWNGVKKADSFGPMCMQDPISAECLGDLRKQAKIASSSMCGPLPSPPETNSRLWCGSTAAVSSAA